MCVINTNAKPKFVLKAVFICLYFLKCGYKDTPPNIAQILIKYTSHINARLFLRKNWKVDINFGRLSCNVLNVSWCVIRIVRYYWVSLCSGLLRSAYIIPHFTWWAYPDIKMAMSVSSGVSYRKYTLFAFYYAHLVCLYCRWYLHFKGKARS